MFDRSAGPSPDSRIRGVEGRQVVDISDLIL
jgi:hypothetical protein